MFTIEPDNTIHITRGDIGALEVSAMKSETESYIFQPGDVVRLRVFVKKRHDLVVLMKDIHVDEETEIVSIPLLKRDTTIGEIINKPAAYWYEVELNPDTIPQTIIGYDTNGPKIFKLYPEGGDLV